MWIADQPNSTKKFYHSFLLSFTKFFVMRNKIINNFLIRTRNILIQKFYF